jgi:magnesium-transporting ATPase (P-type)
MNIVANRSISILGQNQDLNLVYPNNFISNCKYSTLNFLPINLLEQFSRLEILWFFFISLLQLLPFDLSPFGSTSLTNYGTILPLCFIVLVSTAKDWYNARKIIKSDRIINSQKVQVVEDVNGKVNELKWEDIKVGSVVILQQDQFCPADLLLIASSIKDGLAFVETSNLDGEIRLQQKETLRDFQGIYENSRNSLEAVIRKLKDATLDVEQPNSRLYEFEGTLNTEENTAHSFNIQNFLLRGSRIKNVEQVVGIVVFTGPDTKLMQNTQILMRKKCSKAQKKLSEFSFFIIIEIWVLASISAVLAAVSFKYGKGVRVLGC